MGGSNLKRRLKKAHLDASGTETLKLDMMCPDKGCNGKLLLINQWELKGHGKRKTKSTGTMIKLYACQKCGLTVRRYEKLPKKEMETNE